MENILLKGNVESIQNGSIGIDLLNHSEENVGIDLIAVDDPKVIYEREYPFGEYEMDSLASNGIYSNIKYIEYRTNLFIDQSIAKSFCLLFPRSSISNMNLSLANSVGVIDTGYRGEFILRFRYITPPYELIDSSFLNHSTKKFFLTKMNEKSIYRKGDKIGQIVFLKRESVNFTFSDLLSSSNREDGGFGSTGR